VNPPNPFEFPQLEIERNQRKEAAEAKRRLTRFHRLRDAIEQRAIKCDDQKVGKKATLSEELLRPKFLPLEDHPVHLDEDGSTLVWPAAFSYPEFLFSDFQQQLPETATMRDCLTTLFNEPLPCDKTQSYRLGNVHVYYENRKVGCVHKVSEEKQLAEIIAEKGFFVSGGALLFYVVPKDSRVEQEFIHEQRRPMVYS